MTQLKMMNIKSTLAKYDFDILALTETKVTIKNAKFMAKSVGINKHYTVFGIIDNAHINSTGIIILVKNDIANHVTDVQDHLGRIIKIDFNFSKYNKFSIIAIYNKSGNSVHARDSRQTLNQIVINLIKEARRKQQQIIFMGDFNLRFDRYEKLKNKRVRIKNQFSIFKYLENHEFIDVHKDFLNIDDQNLSKRYSTFQNYSTFSRIDYMWITNNLYDGVIKAKIIEYNSLDTDHSLLSMRFIRNNVIFQPIRTNKNIKAGRIKYLYEDLDEDSKKMIIDMTEKELDVRLKNYTPTNLDEKWNIYNHVIATIKKNHIKHKEIKIVVDKEDQDIKNTLEYRFYRYIVYIRRGLKKAKGLEQIKKNWKKIVRNLRSILKALEINVDFYILSYYFRIVLIDTYLKEIEELFSVAYISLNTEMGKKKEKKIMEAIERRQQDLEYDQRRMIDSVMEREFKKINIDRLIVQDQDGEDVLITDENQIKVLVANHFQNCAGSVNCEKEIPNEWINEYKPKEDILESIYDEVLFPENNLIFVDQITTLDKNYLLSIEEMELKRYTKLISTKRMSQEHRKSYERIIIDLSCSKISFKIKTQIRDNMLALDEIYNLKGTILLPATILPEKGATIVSRLTRGKFQNRTVFGRVIKTNVDNKIIYFNHFETLTDDFEKNIILRKCEGCELGTLNAEVFKKEVKSKCLIIERIDSTFLLSPNRWNKQHHSKRLQKNTYYYEGISANFYDEALRKDKFNFIDLIKGIFPKQLYDYIEKLEVIGKKNIVSLGTELLQYVMDETKQHIWLPRCEKLKIIEKRHGITEKDKKKSDSNVGKEKQEDILQRPINLFGRYEDLEGVKEYILFGKEILDFTVVVNRVESSIKNLREKGMISLFFIVVVD
ncbi:hypothetical protein RhiirB3_393426 [Rhizophagus irregularis]|nr:hypothetical protein RhiirB3_393426 [Rhizophagus irregularis]